MIIYPPQCGHKILKGKKQDIGRVTRKITMSIFCTLVEFIFNSDQTGKLLVYTPSSPMTDIVDIESMLAEKNINHLLQPVDGGKQCTQAAGSKRSKRDGRLPGNAKREKPLPEQRET